MNDAYTLVSGKDMKTDKKTSRGKVKAKKNSEAKAKAAAKARATAKKKAEAKAKAKPKAKAKAKAKAKPKAKAKAKAKNNTGKKASGAVNGKNKINNHTLELDIQYFAKKSKPKASSTSKAKTNTGKKASGADKLLKPDLLDELSKSGVKYNPDDVVMVGKNSSDKLFWLEKGDDKAGLKHIINRHLEDFNAKGIQDIPNFLQDTLQKNPIKQGTGPKGPYSVYVIDGQKYTLAYGNNGFVVSFYPSK